MQQLLICSDLIDACRSKRNNDTAVVCRLTLSTTCTTCQAMGRSQRSFSVLSSIISSVWRAALTSAQGRPHTQTHMHTHTHTHASMHTYAHAHTHTNTHTQQWRIQSWSQGGFPKAPNVSGWWRSVPVTVSLPSLKKIMAGEVSGQPENPLDTPLHRHTDSDAHMHACTHTCTHTHKCMCTHTCKFINTCFRQLLGRRWGIKHGCVGSEDGVRLASRETIAQNG